MEGRDIEQKVETKQDTKIEETLKKQPLKIELKSPAECQLLINYQDPITEDYILEVCNRLKEKKFCDELWSRRDRDIHGWM